MLDSGVSHHITLDLQNLSLHDPYSGSDNVVIGYGHGLPIAHTGSASLSYPTCDFSLSHVLHVPSMEKNLLSVYRLFVNNNVAVTFDLWMFQVKDLSSGLPSSKGKR